MAVTPVQTGFPVILNLSGTGLNGGSVYIGVAGQDPELFPVPLFWDAAGTVTAAQPLATIGGYIARAGTPAAVYVGAAYSIRVRDRQGVQVYYTPYAGDVTGTGVSTTGPYDIALNVSGQGVLSGEVLLVMPMVRAISMPINYAGALGQVAGNNPGAPYTALFQKNGGSIGQLQISTAGVFSFSSFGLPVSFAVNDVFRVVSAGAESSLSFWGFTLPGVRS